MRTTSLSRGYDLVTTSSLPAVKQEPIFIDRDPRAFEHVLNFLRAAKLPRLPSFSSDPELWRALREEVPSSTFQQVPRAESTNQLLNVGPRECM